MTFTIDETAEATRTAVRALLLQPPPTNPVRHGIDALASAGFIDVRAAKRGDRLAIELSTAAASARPRVKEPACANTRERLQHLYGDAAVFSIGNERAVWWRRYQCRVEQDLIPEPLRVILVDGDAGARVGAAAART